MNKPKRQNGNTRSARRGAATETPAPTLDFSSLPAQQMERIYDSIDHAAQDAEMAREVFAKARERFGADRAAAHAAVDQKFDQLVQEAAAYELDCATFGAAFACKQMRRATGRN